MDNAIILLLLIIAAILPAPVFNGISYRQSLGIEWTGIALSYGLSKKFHWSVGLCVFWLMFECFIHQSSFISLISLLFFICGTLFLTENISSFLLLTLGIISVIDSSFIIYRYFSTFDINNAWWVLTSASMDSSFISLMIPFVLTLNQSELRTTSFILMALAIIISRSNTALFSSIVIIASHGLASKQLGGKFLAGILGLFGLASAYLFNSGKLFEDQGRFSNWKTMISYWYENINIWIGAGPGQYHNYAAKINPPDQQFVHMHNDLLQILFETGIIGAGLIIILYFMLLKHSFNRPTLFSMIVGFGFISMTLFPVYLFFFQMLGVLLIYKCFQQEEMCPILA